MFGVSGYQGMCDPLKTMLGHRKTCSVLFFFVTSILLPLYTCDVPNGDIITLIREIQADVKYLRMTVDEQGKHISEQNQRISQQNDRIFQQNQRIVQDNDRIAKQIAQQNDRILLVEEYALGNEKNIDWCNS